MLSDSSFDHLFKNVPFYGYVKYIAKNTVLKGSVKTIKGLFFKTALAFVVKTI